MERISVLMVVTIWTVCMLAQISLEAESIGFQMAKDGATSQGALWTPLHCIAVE